MRYPAGRQQSAGAERGVLQTEVCARAQPPGRLPEPTSKQRCQRLWQTVIEAPAARPRGTPANPPCSWPRLPLQEELDLLADRRAAEDGLVAVLGDDVDAFGPPVDPVDRRGRPAGEGAAKAQTSRRSSEGDGAGARSSMAAPAKASAGRSGKALTTGRRC